MSSVKNPALANNIIEECFSTAAKNIQTLNQSQEVRQAVARAGQVMAESSLHGGTIYIAGNGGSAADAQHISAELLGKLDKDRTPIRAFALSTDSSLLTAVGNDYSYDHIFARQVQGLVRKGDIFLGITTSGNSKNILTALEACKKAGGTSILLTGKDGGKCKALADHTIIAPGPVTAAIQEAHIVIYHALCWIVEKTLVEAGAVQYF